jgi:two-component system, NarL family, invasion response regulator UvrY
MKLLIVDDHKIIREGLKQILLLHFPSAIIDEAASAEDVMNKTLKSEYDVIICDLSLPGRSGLDVLKQVKELYPKLPVLILSMHPEENYAVRALQAGASGYLNKADGAEILVAAIHKALQGRKYIPSSVAEQIADNLRSKTRLLTDNNLHEDLSDRELHVFKLIAEGKSVSDISDLLSLSLSAVSTYRSRILKKMLLKTNADLTKYALQHDLI